MRIAGDLNRIVALFSVFETTSAYFFYRIFLKWEVYYGDLPASETIKKILLNFREDSFNLLDQICFLRWTPLLGQ